MPVTVFFSEFPLDKPWQKTGWYLEGVLPIRTQESPGVEHPVYASSGTGHRIVRWDGLKVRLERGSCQAYYDNISSPTPKIFVISHFGSDKKPRPYLVTLDLTEAEACMEAGEQVYSCPLNPDLYLFLERFVVENYMPKLPAKRQRIS